MQSQPNATTGRFHASSFEAHLAGIRHKKKVAMDAIGDVSDGRIVRHESGTRWVFLLPDMTEAGKWRMQRFDERGFSGHGIFNTAQELVEAAVGEGFKILDPDALDRLQETLPFQRGNFLADLVRQVNTKQITMEELNRLVIDYDAQHH